MKGLVARAKSQGECPRNPSSYHSHWKYKPESEVERCQEGVRLDLLRSWTPR